MPVTQQNIAISYRADGSSTSFLFPYYFINQTDLLIQQITGSGAVITNAINTDYSISGTPNTFGDYPTGANVVFNSPPTSGNTINIVRLTAKTQLVQFIDNSPFTADSINHVIDKLTLIVQELFGQFQGTVSAPPTTGTYAVGNWWLNSNPQPGGSWGWVCTSSTPLIINPFGLISL